MFKFNVYSLPVIFTISWLCSVTSMNLNQLAFASWYNDLQTSGHTSSEDKLISFKLLFSEIYESLRFLMGKARRNFHDMQTTLLLTCMFWRNRLACIDIYQYGVDMYVPLIIHSNQVFGCLEGAFERGGSAWEHPREAIVFITAILESEFPVEGLSANLTFDAFSMMHTAGTECPKASVTLVGFSEGTSMLTMCGQLGTLLTGLMSTNNAFSISIQGSFSTSDRLHARYYYRSAARIHIDKARLETNDSPGGSVNMEGLALQSDAAEWLYIHYIRVDLTHQSRLPRIHLGLQGGDSWRHVIYDGPGRLSPELTPCSNIRWLSTWNKMGCSAKSSSHQVTVYSHGDMLLATKWSTEILFSQGVATEGTHVAAGCSITKNRSMSYIDSDETFSIHAESTSEVGLHNVICSWHLIPGHGSSSSVNLTIKAAHFKGVVTEHCAYGGLYVFGQNIEYQNELIFSLCSKTPLSVSEPVLNFLSTWG